MTEPKQMPTQEQVCGEFSKDLYRILELHDDSVKRAIDIVDGLGKNQMDVSNEQVATVLMKYLSPTLQYGGRGIIGLGSLDEFGIEETNSIEQAMALAQDGFTAIVRDSGLVSLFIPPTSSAFESSNGMAVMQIVVNNVNSDIEVALKSVGESPAPLSITNREAGKHIAAWFNQIMESRSYPPITDTSEDPLKELREALSTVSLLSQTAWATNMDFQTKLRLVSHVEHKPEPVSPPIKTPMVMEKPSTLADITNAIVQLHISNTVVADSTGWLEPGLDLGTGAIQFTGRNTMLNPDQYAADHLGIVFGSSDLDDTGSPLCNQVTFNLDDGSLVVIDKVTTAPRAAVYVMENGTFRIVLAGGDRMEKLQSLLKSLDELSLDIGQKDTLPVSKAKKPNSGLRMNH